MSSAHSPAEKYNDKKKEVAMSVKRATFFSLPVSLSVPPFFRIMFVIASSIDTFFHSLINHDPVLKLKRDL